MNITPETSVGAAYPEGTMEKLISLAKRRGFIYQGSEIYGGLAGTWDYGPLGVALKNNIKGIWWKQFVLDREDMYGVDAAILMNQNVWKASGHVDGFADPLVECMSCNKRFRVDQIVDEAVFKNYLEAAIQYCDERVNGFESRIKEHVKMSDELAENLKTMKEYPVSKTVENEIAKDALDWMLSRDSKDEDFKKIDSQLLMVKDAIKYTGLLTQHFLNENIVCQNCKEKRWGVPRQFNMMLQTSVGAIQDESSVSYLRPETAQGMFVNFKNVVDSFHPKLPFGLAQIGKAFRNEIAPRDFIFRTREFEQMEIEYFIKPPKDDADTAWMQIFDHFREQVMKFTTDIGLTPSKIHELEVAPEDRAHYSKRTIDFEFDYTFGKKELYGLAYRTDFDLGAHAGLSKADLRYFDEQSEETDSEKKKYIAHCIEPSFGVDRTVLAVLMDAYREDNLGGELRPFMAFSPKVAPILVAVSPLLKNKPQLVERARDIFNILRKAFPGRVAFDDNGNIGKRYRRQDEIGTPFCVVVDFDTIEATDEKKDTVTVRHRDSGEQERISVDRLKEMLTEATA